MILKPPSPDRWLTFWTTSQVQSFFLISLQFPAFREPLFFRRLPCQIFPENPSLPNWCLRREDGTYQLLFFLLLFPKFYYFFFKCRAEALRDPPYKFARMFFCIDFIGDWLTLIASDCRLRSATFDFFPLSSGKVHLQPYMLPPPPLLRGLH